MRYLHKNFLIVVIIDVCLLAASLYLANLIRFEFDIPYGGGEKGTVGDCWDRYIVRVREIEQSCRLIRQAMDEAGLDFADLDADALRGLLTDFAKNWLAHDGVWFQAVERAHGMEQAMAMDAEAWGRFARIEARRDVVDISFFAENPFALDEKARQAGVTAIVDCGVAPGMSNLLAGHVAKRLDRAALEDAGGQQGHAPAEPQMGEDHGSSTPRNPVRIFPSAR